MLAAAIMQPLTGWIGRRFGEVRTLVTSICLFMVFSALCGLATSLPMLVASRLIQGLVSGPMMSVAQAILLRNYPLERRAMAIALWSMVLMGAPILGPILGGWITDNLSWPWLFYINLPVGAFAATACWSILRHRESAIVKLPIDGIGLVLLVIGVGSLQFMFDNGNEKDWFNSPVIVAAAAASVVAFTFLIPWELTDKHPVVDLHLFKRRNFRIGVLTLSIAYFAFSGINVVFPLWLQTTVGYTATWAGLAVAPVAVLALFVAPVVGRNMLKINLRVLHIFGRDLLDGDSERHGEFRSVRLAAIPARIRHRVFLSAAEPNPPVRGPAERACIGIRAEQFHTHHGGKLLDCDHGVDLESAHRLSPCGAVGAYPNLGASLDAIPVSAGRPRHRRHRRFGLCERHHQRASLNTGRK
jgi:MFS family permease